MKFGRVLMTFSVCLAALIGVMTGGCSTEDTPEPKRSSKKSEPAAIVAETLLKAQAKAISTQVLCTKPEECPEAVGMLVSIAEPPKTADEKGGKYRVSSCTATLVSPNILLTNAHCIPAELRSAGTVTKNKLWVFFPAIGKKIKKAWSAVASVIDVNQPSPGQVGMDYAFLQTEIELDRKPLPMSTAGVSDALDVRMVRVNPQHGTLVPYGFVGMEYCHIVERTALAPYFNSPTSPVVTFTGCNMRGGNSGSTLINTRNEIWGVASADQLTEVKLKTADGKTVTQLAPSLEPLVPLLQSDRIETLNIATNMSCVQVPGKPRELPTSCAVDFNLYGDLETNARMLFDEAKPEEVFENSLAAWEKNRDKRLNRFEWRLVKLESGSPLDDYLRSTKKAGAVKEIYYPMPSCLKPSRSKLSAANFSLPLFSMRFSLNQHLQISTEEVRLKRPPQAVLKPSKDGSQRITVSIRSSNRSDDVIFDEVLAPCAK